MSDINIPFRYPLPVKVGQEIDQVEVLKQQWAILANTLGLLWVHDRAAIAGRVDRRILVLRGHSCQ